MSRTIFPRRPPLEFSNSSYACPNPGLGFSSIVPLLDFGVWPKIGAGVPTLLLDVDCLLRVSCSLLLSDL